MSQPQVTQVEVKGFFNSSTIFNILMMVGTLVVTKLVENSAWVIGTVQSFTPDWVDPMVPGSFEYIMAILIPYFGIKAVVGRVQVGDIKGMYRKQN